MLWTGFSLRLSLYFGALSLCSTLASPSVPAAEKQPHRMRLELRFIKPENLLSHSLRAFWVLFFCKFQVFSCVFTEERIASGHTSIKHRLVECCSGVCPSVGFFYFHI